jgi:MtN3 and saliva related transmembrane protein
MLSKEFIELGFSLSLLANALLFIPQIISLLRYKSAEGLSLLTFAGFCVFQIFTMLHGFLTADFLLAGGYLLSLLSCGTVTLLIVYYRYRGTK